MVADIYREVFGEEPLLVRSPGRVNLIGEHTDYNEGFVLPAAINKAIYIASGKRNDDELHFIAADIDERYSSSLSSFQKKPGHWSDYINGVVDQLLKAGHKLSGFNCVLGGDIPTGAGLSSSAAVECSVIFSLNQLFGLGLDKMTMVKLAQKAENEYVGVQCGIMDQFASMFGKAGHAIRLDCRSLEYTYEPLDLKGIRIVLFDTNVKHSLAGSEYNTRRKQCEEGVALVRSHHPHVKSLRDVSEEMVEQYLRHHDITVYERCLYVVQEIERLQQACSDLEKNDLVSFGKKMFATHHGLSKLYDVSCKELDFLVEQVRNEPAVLGARMMGGGFGGCTINLIKEESIDRISASIAEAYRKAYNTDLKTYVTETKDGTSNFAV
jgi:galactokinase